MTEAGLTIREDPMGNIFGRMEGADPSAGAGSFPAHATYTHCGPASLHHASMHSCMSYNESDDVWTLHAAGAVMTGSHIDAIPLAGAYDGTLGVIGAIAALHALRRSGFRPQKPIDALMFTSEEPSRFGLGCIGR